MKVPSVFLVATFVAAVSEPASAQILYGGLVGNVTDSSAGAIPGAKVTINHVATGTTRETPATEAGTYRFPTLPTGTYTVTVEASGFRSASPASR